MKKPRRISVSFEPEAWRAMRAEAARLDRSVSWVVQRAWLHARAKLRAIPAPKRQSE